MATNTLIINQLAQGKSHKLKEKWLLGINQTAT